jgi:hypothetical protein
LKNKLIIKFAKKKDIIKIQKFIKFHYKKNHILARNQKLFEWLYIDKISNCTLALKNNKIVGVYLYIPLKKFDEKLNKERHVFGSLWVIKDFKNHVVKNLERENVGIALRLFYKTYELLKPKLVVASGMDPRLCAFHNLKKYKLSKLNHHFIVSPYIKKTKIIKNFIFSNKSKKRGKNKTKISFKKICNAKELKNLSINSLFRYQIPLKSKIYLINRYLNHPFYKYHIYVISKEKIINICILRIIKFKNTNVIRFVDYVGSNRSFTILNPFFHEILNIYKAEYLDFYSHGIPLNILKKAGLKNRNENEKLIIPSYFEPFINKNIDVVVGYKKFNIKGEIRIFKADSDQDRPNF